MIPLEEALKILAEAVPKGSLPVETLPVRKAVGRVLASPCRACLDVPPFDRVTMDGFAVADTENESTLVVAGELRAGQKPEEPVRQGVAVKVMTGCPAPPGTGRVVPVEKTEQKDGMVHLLPASLGKNDRGRRNIAPRGQDLKVGQIVVDSGLRLDAARAASLITAGVTEVQVSRQPTIAVMATGDELVEDPGSLRQGQIPNSNGPMLAWALNAWGYPVDPEPVVPDDLQETARRISAALEKADLVVLSGGVSAGDYDFVPAALEQLGLEIMISRVALQPGKPVVFARGERGFVFGLPGNPASAFVTAHVFVLPALARLEGEERQPRFVTLPLADPYSGRAKPRRQLLPARLTPDGRVRLLAYHGSGHLHALTAADGLIRLDPEVSVLEAGAEVLFWPLKTDAFLTTS